MAAALAIPGDADPGAAGGEGRSRRECIDVRYIDTFPVQPATARPTTSRPAMIDRALPQLGTYPGSKAGFGTLHNIIGAMPEHQVYVEAFLGHGAVLRAKRPACSSIGIDADAQIIARWGGMPPASSPSAPRWCAAMPSSGWRIARRFWIAASWSTATRRTWRRPGRACFTVTSWRRRRSTVGCCEC
jgi:hypothetical protein